MDRQPTNHVTLPCRYCDWPIKPRGMRSHVNGAFCQGNRAKRQMEKRKWEQLPSANYRSTLSACGFDDVKFLYFAGRAGYKGRLTSYVAVAYAPWEFVQVIRAWQYGYVTFAGEIQYPRTTLRHRLRIAVAEWKAKKKR